MPAESYIYGNISMPRLSQITLIQPLLCSKGLDGSKITDRNLKYNFSKYIKAFKLTPNSVNYEVFVSNKLQRFNISETTT